MSPFDTLLFEPGVETTVYLRGTGNSTGSYMKRLRFTSSSETVPQTLKDRKSRMPAPGLQHKSTSVYHALKTKND